MVNDAEDVSKYLGELFDDPPITGPLWDRQAAELQRRIIESDHDRSKWAPPVTAAQVKLAILHTRHDMVMLVSYLSSANAQLRTIRRLLAFVSGLLGVIAILLMLR